MRRHSVRTASRAYALAMTSLLMAPGLLAGCGSSDVPEPSVPQAPPPVVQQVETREELPPPPERRPAPRKSEEKSLTVVIDPGDENQVLTRSGERTSLIEASRAARAMKDTAPPPAIVIDNENLSDYADRGKLTIVSPGAVPDDEPVDGVSAQQDAGPAKDEEYWRSSARELRELWAEAEEDITALSERADSLRLRFYAEENVYLRDSQIKPAWDRVLDRLDTARRQAVQYENELDTLLEEGRRAGALPGWLREGIELEPRRERRPRGDLEDHESMEPDVVEEGKP